MPTRPPNAQRGSSNDTAYNGSEGHIENGPSFEFDPRGIDNVQLVRSPVVTPPRPALGARFLSSLSNAQPAAAALSRKGSVLHSRAKSLAAFVPKLNTSNSSTPERTQAPNKIFGDLFNGESAPIRLGAPVSPTKEKEESEFVMEYTPTLTERPGDGRRRSTAQSIPAKSNSWFTRKPTFSTPSKLQPQDELASLNINASLFPNGPVDPLNPAAFNDLLLNATHLLQRMQTAYKEKTNFIASLQPELDAQREEVEEADIRSKHLKLQLEDMGRQAQEQGMAMQDMARQLAEEKVRGEEGEETARTVRLIRRSTTDSRDGDDEETPTRRRKRTSGGSASDSGFESDLESVFSGGSNVETPISPPSVSATSDYADSPSDLQQPKGRDALLTIQRRAAAGSTVPSNRSSISNKRLGSEGAAWATVEALRGENRALKMQVEQMEGTLQGCIDFVSGLDA